MLKRNLALLIIATIIISCAPVFAAQPVPYSRTEGFSNVALNNAPSFSSSGWTSSSFGKVNSTMNYDGANGIFGRESTDKCAYLWNNSEVEYTNTLDPYQFFVMEDNAANRADISLGEYYEISFDFAFDGEARDRHIDGFLSNAGFRANGTTANDGKMEKSQLLFINKNGTLRALSTDVPNFTASKAKWYNFKFVLKAGDNNALANEEKNSFDFYVDNVLLLSTTFVPQPRDTVLRYFTGFYKFWIGQDIFNVGSPSETHLYPTTKTYVDNLKIATTPVKTRPSSKILSFTNSVSGDVSSFRGDWKSASTYKNYNALKYAIAEGKFGRDSSDKSMHIWNDSNTPCTEVGADPYQFVVFEDDRSLAVAPTLGQYYEMSFYMAYNGEFGYKSIDAFYSGTANDGKNSYPIFEIRDNKKVYVLGDYASNLTIEESKWYKYTLVFKAGDNSAVNDADKNSYKFYIDDKLMLEKVFVPSARTVAFNTFSGFYKFWVGQHFFSNGKNTAEGLYTTRNLYFDEVKVATSASEPLYTPLKLTTTNTDVSKYLSDNLYIYTENDAKTGGTWGAVGEDVTVNIKNEQGNQVAENIPLINSYLKVVRGDNSVLYGRFNNQYTEFKNVTFGANDDGTYASDFNYAKKNFTTETYPSGVSGKRSDDYCLKMVTTDCDGKNDQHAPFLQLFAGTGTSTGIGILNLNTEIPTHVEYSLLLQGDGWYGQNFHVIPNDGSAWLKEFSMNQDGSIANSKGAIVARFNKNEWIKLGISMYPASNTAELRINGKLVSTDQLFANNTAKLERFKLENAYPMNSGDLVPPKYNSGAFAVDDFKVYQGARISTSSEDNIALTTASSNYDIYNKGKVIYMDYEMGQLDFYGDISGIITTPIEPTIFSDITLTQAISDVDDISNGNVLLVSDGNIYKYYEIRTGNPQTLEITSIYDGNGNDLETAEFAAGNITVNPIINVYKENTEVTAVIAQYDTNNKLVNVEVATKTLCPISTASNEYTHTQVINSWKIEFEVKDVANSNTKIMLWSDLVNLSPLCNSKSFMK